MADELEDLHDWVKGTIEELNDLAEELEEFEDTESKHVDNAEGAASMLNELKGDLENKMESSDDILSRAKREGVSRTVNSLLQEGPQASDTFFNDIASKVSDRFEIHRSDRDRGIILVSVEGDVVELEIGSNSVTVDGDSRSAENVKSYLQNNVSGIRKIN